MIQTEALQIIQTVAHFGSFTTAAKHLHKVPSAISYTVRKVEEQLGVQLFIRDSRRVELTPAGLHFVENARRILDDLTLLSTSTCQIATGVESDIYIVLDNIINQGAIIPLITAFGEKFPDTHLHISTEVYIGCWDALFHNRCQLAIGAPVTIPNEVENHPALEWKTMGPLDWKLVMAPDHPLASRDHETEITPDELSQYTTIVVEDSARVLHRGGDDLAHYGHRLVMPSFRQALACTAEGLGICMAPSHFADHMLRDGTLVSRRAPALDYNQKCLMAWNKENMGAALRWCLQWLGNKRELSKQWLTCRPGMAHIDIS
ncbi:LysR substrate-binding domain-containing protein [Parendozoicomonas haliclonae]|uniref:HTH-type transcriptional activator AllS n=1 Tax=Parendozoicomonas haliclonae TaxID=1960125 RepID=A0A1X7APL9_9GAMM|nr:LysR substrate-binding domain-containing protein [Parendozoicomonas haliclonae]SMA50048.1 HTH-type transcriptional activator AllS [Parendozoicomonas haliclonae]